MTVDAAFWDNLAEEYAAKPVDNPDAFERKIAITRQHLQPDHTVLEVGCGTGSLALRLADAAGAIHGLDLSPGMLRIAQGKISAQGVENVFLHTGAFDEDFDAFGPESLDVLLAYSIVHLVPDPPAALAQIYRLIKPGGTFISSTVTLGDGWTPYGLILPVMRWLGKAPLVHVIPRGQLLQWVREAGFVDLELPDVGAGSNTTFLVARKPVQ